MSRALKSAGSALSRAGQQLFGGGSSHSSQQSGLDPRFFNMFASNLERATGVAEGLGPRQFADFTPDFQAGAQALRDAVGGPGAQTVGAAISMLQQPGGGVGAFLNPHTDAVVESTLADLDRQRQIQQQQIGHSATQAGAFGGSRHGVAEAETNRAFADVGARMAADLRQRGYDTAVQQALQTSGLLGMLGGQQQQMGLQGAAALLGLGERQQQHLQQQLDAIRNLPLEQQAIINEALGLNPGGGAGMQSSGRSQSDTFSGLLQQFGGNQGFKLPFGV